MTLDEQVLDLRKQRMTQKQIAQKVHRGVEYVSNILKQGGLNQQLHHVIDERAIIEASQQGLSLNELSRTLHKSPKTILFVLAKNNVTFEKHHSGRKKHSTEDEIFEVPDPPKPHVCTMHEIETIVDQFGNNYGQATVVGISPRLFKRKKPKKNFVPDTEGCADCKFSGKIRVEGALGGWTDNEILCCDYLYQTGQMRGCAPGTKCTKKLAKMERKKV